MHRITRAALLGTICLAFAFPAAAQTEAPAEAPAEGQAAAPAVTADTVVATVNGTDITVGHMLVLRARLPQQYQTLPPEALFDGILDQLIQQELLRGQGQELSRVGKLMLENEERTLIAVQAAEKIAAEKVTDEAIQAAYDESYAKQEPGTEYNAAHILVETQEEAQAIVDELSGGADFATIAKERSKDPGSGQNGGDLGWFGLGMMVPEFEQAVVALEPGAVSAPVQSQFGWHVIKLNETRPLPIPTLEEVREEIATGLEQQAVEAVIAELQESATITRAEPGQIDPAVIGNVNLLEE
jgi:peptidyl-prolyl cis-trans isomerase C